MISQSFALGLRRFHWFACGGEAAAGRGRAGGNFRAQREGAQGCGEDDWERLSGGAVRGGQGRGSGLAVCDDFEGAGQDRGAVRKCGDLQICAI